VEALDEGNRKRILSSAEQIFSKHFISDKTYFHALVQVVRSISLVGPSLFFGRGACHILRDMNALSIRIIALWEDRLHRVRESEHCSVEEAARKIEDQDRMKRQFIMNHYKKDIDDPTAYHLVLNTSLVDPEAASAVILDLYRRMAAPSWESDRPGKKQTPMEGAFASG
jgi:cytidylate kinase